MKLKNKRLVNRLILIGILLFLFGILSLMKQNKEICEYVFSRGFSRAYITAVGYVTSALPFSVVELFIVATILALISLLVFWTVMLVKKRPQRATKSFLNTATAALVLILLYTATAGMSYNRYPIALPQYSKQQLSTEEITEVAESYLADYSDVCNKIKRDENGFAILPSFEEASVLLKKEYERLNENDYFTRFTPTAKKVFFSEFMSYQNITGMSFAPTGEPTVNVNTPPCYRLLTMAHEMAHAKGIMHENDANLTAYYLLMTSDVPELRYASYMYGIPAFLAVIDSMGNRELYVELYKKIPYAARYERVHEWDGWEKYDSIIDKAAEFFNDMYLKISGLDEGTSAYVDTSKTQVVVDPSSGESKIILVDYSPVQKLYIELYLQNSI